MLFFLLLLSKCISAELSGHSNMAKIKVPLIKSCGGLFLWEIWAGLAGQVGQPRVQGFLVYL